MVVMPGLSEREHGEPADVRRLVLDVKAPASEEVADRVDRPGDVMDEEDPHQAAPDEPLKRAADGEAVEQEAGERRDRERDEREQGERPSDPPHRRILIEIGSELLPIGLTLGLEQPADMCEHESAQAAAVPDVGA